MCHESKKKKDDKNETLLQCTNSTSEDKMIFCDRCDRGYHSFCVGLKSVPNGKWQCKGCHGNNTGALINTPLLHLKEEHLESTTPDTTKVKRGRGRPPKVKNPDDVGTETPKEKKNILGTPRERK